MVKFFKKIGIFVTEQIQCLEFLLELIDVAKEVIESSTHEGDYYKVPAEQMQKLKEIANR